MFVVHEHVSVYVCVCTIILYYVLCIYVVYMLYVYVSEFVTGSVVFATTVA